VVGNNVASLNLTARRFNGEKGGDERYVAPFTEALSW
jgi:hypothetical protein